MRVSLPRRHGVVVVGGVTECHRDHLRGPVPRHAASPGERGTRPGTELGLAGQPGLTYMPGLTLLFVLRSETLQNLKPGRLSVSLRATHTL